MNIFNNKVNGYQIAWIYIFEAAIFDTILFINIRLMIVTAVVLSLLLLSNRAINLVKVNYLYKSISS